MLISSPQNLCKIGVLKQSQSALLCCVSHIAMLSVFTCMMNVRDHTSQAFVTCIVHFVTKQASLFTDHNMSGTNFVAVGSFTADGGLLQPKGCVKTTPKIAVAMLKKTRQLRCVFQDMEPPKSSSILRKSSNILKPIRCVQFTKAVLRHANIRDQNPSLGMICPGDPHQRNPNAPKLEDWSQEETEWQERCVREAAWRLAKNILKLKGKT